MLNLAFGPKPHGSQDPSALGLASWSERTLNAALESGGGEVSAALLFVPSGFTAQFGLPVLAKASAHQHGNGCVGFNQGHYVTESMMLQQRTRVQGFRDSTIGYFIPAIFFYFLQGSLVGFFV